MLDEVGRARGKTLGLSVRVPNTIAGAAMLGLDVEEWIADHLVDIVIPSTFFAQETEEDMREWVKLAAGTPVLVHPAVEEGFAADRQPDGRRPGGALRARMDLTPSPPRVGVNRISVRVERYTRAWPRGCRWCSATSKSTSPTAARRPLDPAPRLQAADVETTRELHPSGAAHRGRAWAHPSEVDEE